MAMAVINSYRRTLVTLVALVLLLLFYAESILEITGLKGTTCNIALLSVDSLSVTNTGEKGKKRLYFSDAQ